MSTSNQIPVFSSLTDVYPEHRELQEARFAKLNKLFSEKFTEVPELIARSPGRVNLIGEHVDYEGFSVFPMAIHQDTVVAIRKYGSQLVVANVKEEAYGTEIFEVDPGQEVDVFSHKWTNYFLAAYKGVYEFLDKKQIPHEGPLGLQILVDGQVPTGSGLSSSSSLVCSCAIAILAALGVLELVSKAEIAEFTCSCERFSGTESGGMDQAISILAQAGLAKVIDFNPVRGTDVKLPETGIFVVANSLTVSNKAQTASERYNLRVVECKLAAIVLAKLLGLSSSEIQDIQVLKQIQDLELDLQKKLDSEETSASQLSVLAVEKLLKDGAYSLQEVEEIIGFPVKPLFSGSPNGLRVLESSSGKGFQLRNRALHVFKEADRVKKVKCICEDSNLSEDEKMKQIGDLMNQSHTSCHELYDCSCSELQELVMVCNSFGAVGSRLTGAGWGGCVVALVPESHHKTFIQKVKENFYSKRVQSNQIREAELDGCIFASKPSTGAAVLDLKEE